MVKYKPKSLILSIFYDILKITLIFESLKHFSVRRVT